MWSLQEEAPANPASEAIQAEPLSDGILLQRSGRGDHNAFAELVQRYERWARSYARNIVRDEHEAEDLAQEAFLRLWRSAPRWRPTGSVQAFLKVILGNVCIDHLRRKRPIPAEVVDDRPDGAPGPLHLAASAQAAERMATLIEELPATQRMAILLIYGENMRYAEAAEAMKLGIKAFESLLHRARVNLRKGWKRYET